MSALPDLAARVQRVHAASLADAMAKAYPHRAHVLDLVSPTPGKVLFGEAVTMAFVPVRHDVEDKQRFDFARLLREAAGAKPEGKVLVAANYGPPAGAVAGGIRLGLVEELRLAGLLTNGRLRDFDEVRQCSFVAYCRGETPYAGSREIMPHAANVPVSIDGATVFPGDYVYADGAGAVVIPARDVEKILAEALRIEEEDAERARKMRSG